MLEFDMLEIDFKVSTVTAVTISTADEYHRVYLDL